MNDGQNDRLDISAGTLQAEEDHGVLRVQPVTATVAEGLQVRLLRERERETLLEARTDEQNPQIRIQIVFMLHLLKCQWPALFDGAESWDHLERFVSEMLRRERAEHETQKEEGRCEGEKKKGASFAVKAGVCRLVSMATGQKFPFQTHFKIVAATDETFKSRTKNTSLIHLVLLYCDLPCEDQYDVSITSIYLRSSMV